MERRRGLDMATACVCGAIMAIAWIYRREGTGQHLILYVSAGLMLFFAVLAVWDSRKGSNGGNRTETSQPGLITELVLLGEEDTELMVWDMYGRVSMVIGRDVKENQVDVDLSSGPYAAMADIEHAVLNFSAGKWYVEDVGSTNGTSIRKAQDGRNYSLSPDRPCLVECGDCIGVGLNRLLLR